MNINVNLNTIKSWKTTLIGVASLILGTVQTYNEGWAMAIHDPKVQMAVVVAVLGFIAKDGDVTGGSVGIPSTPEALAAANQAPATGKDAPVPTSSPK